MVFKAMKRSASRQTGLIWNIQRFNVHDGRGIRTLVFFKGCPLRCKWCANPEGGRHVPEMKFLPDRCVGCGHCAAVCETGAAPGKNGGRLLRRQCIGCGHCAQVCPSGALALLGRWMSVQEILSEVLRDWAFYRRSGGGITLSGGEALMQADFAAELLKQARLEGLDTAVETCGAVPYENIEAVRRDVGTFLFDLKAMDGEQHRLLTGMDNDLILQNAKRLSETGARVVFRTPVIPSVNDSEENIGRAARFAADCGAAGYELLPYHELGAGKYPSLGLNYPLSQIRVPSPEDMERYLSWARAYFAGARAGS